MSAGVIVAIVVVAIILIALLLLLPRIRGRAQEKRRERELQQRRKQVAGEHREEAQERVREAEAAEQRARMAEQEARRERAEAQLHEERAATHERGLADHELVSEDERERFAGTSAARGEGDGDAQRGGDSGTAGAVGEAAGRERTSAYQEGRKAAHEPDRERDFQEGRSDEEGQGDGGGLFGRFRRRSKEPEPTRRG